MKIIKLLNYKILIPLIGCLCLLYCHPVHAYNPDAVNYNNTGIKYTKKGEFEKAVISFKKAIETDSSLNNAYYNLGSVYKHTGNTPQAIKAFQLLLRNNPNDDETAYILAGLYFENQDYDKALVYLSSIDKTSTFYKDSIELFKKINNKINESIIKETPKETPKAASASKPAVSIKTSVPKVSNPVIVSRFVYSNFTGPTGITEDSKGNLYVADYTSNSILILLPDGKLKTTIKNELIKGPVGIVADSSDNIYIANYSANNVLKIDKNGAAKIISKDINKPYFLYLNKSGVLYVSEQDKNTVIRLGIPE